MPNYTFEHKDTGEQTTVQLKMAELDGYKKDHPELIQIMGGLVTVDPILLGITKPPQDFQKHVLGGIKRANPGSTIGTGRWET